MKRRITHRTCAVLIFSLACWNTGHAQDAPSADEGTISLTSGLLLSRATRGGRIALHRDAVEALQLGDAERVFKEGESVAVGTDTVRSWESVSAADNGRFTGRSFRGAYLQFVVDCDRPKIMLLDAHGHGAAIINGEPRGGDTYSRWCQLPVQLREGRNQLLFHVGRGQFRGQLVAAPKPVYLVPNDQTLPDWLRGMDQPVFAAMPIMNASTDHLHDLEIRTSIDGEHVRTTKLGPMLPLTLRKMRFAIGPATKTDADQLTVLVQLMRKGQAEPIDTREVKLRICDPSERHRRTFISEIDGSVQYYSVTPAAHDESSDSATPGMFLSLHGAGVEAQGQAAVYQPKPDGHMVAPTNRRTFGFDWEDWGRGDAMEVLQDAMQKYDVNPQRVFLTGHSMGGHGTWQIGATFPDRFAAIGPSAGWVSFWSYAGGVRSQTPTPIVELLERAANPSDTLLLARNYRSQGVYVLHGDRDNNVPVSQARTMRSVLAEFHPDFVYYERPGAGHWWGNACCDWPPMFEFFRRHKSPQLTELSRIDFTTVCPGVSATFGWATIVDQRKPLQPSRIDLALDRGKLTLAGTTKNVAVLRLDLPSAFTDPMNDSSVNITLDGAKLEVPFSTTWLVRHGDGWQAAKQPALSDKGPHRYGLFKSAFDRRVVFVYGTHGTPEENDWALAKVRYDAETFWYRANGSIDVVADRDFKADDYPDRNVIIYGNADTNSAWPMLLGECPLQVTRETVSLGDRTVNDPRVAALFAYPRQDSDRALIGVVGGTGIEGLRSTNRLRYFVSGVAYPDIMLVSADFLSEGNEKLIAAGFWNSKWQLNDAAIAWNLPQPQTSK